MHFKVDKNKLRLDRYLAENAPVSRSKIQKDIALGLVSVNGVKQYEPKFVVRSGDEIMYEFSLNEEKIQPRFLDLKVIFENEDILIIDKPAGLVVHPAPGYKGVTLVEGLLQRYKDIHLVGEDQVRPGIVHRLDKDTSGVMLVAKTQKMFEYLKNAFSERKIRKEYTALACGHVLPKHGIINSSIGRHSSDFRKMSTHLPKEPKQAITEYEVSQYLINPAKSAKGEVDEYSLILVKLHTGRTHQIRVHFSSLGFPLAGDTLYGKCQAPFLPRQFLHASRIEVRLMDGTWIEAESELPQDLKKVLSNLQLSTSN